MIQFSTCKFCGEKFEQPNVAMLLEPAKTQTLGAFGQRIMTHTATKHPDRLGLIQASTIEFSGFLHMTQFEHTDPEFNTNTRKWSKGIISRIQETLGERPIDRDAALQSLAKIFSVIDRNMIDKIGATLSREDGEEMAAAVAELRRVLDNKADAIT